MKKILCSALLFCAMLAKATVLIDPAGSGGFEAGSDFLSNGWTVVNGEATATQNQWYLGTSATAGIGSGNLAYITNNTATAAYAYSPSSPMYIVHFYKDIEFPAGETDMKLSFSWKGKGESTAYDGLQVSLAPTTITPAAAATAPTGSVSGAIVSGATIIGNTLYYNQTTATTANIVIPASAAGNIAAASTKRLIFTFRMDNSQGTTPGTAIDNISLTTNVPLPEIGMTGNSAAIADGSLTPSAANNTEFGTVPTTAVKNITYTILNTGLGALNLSGSPLVTVSGSSDFSVVTQPVTPVVATNGSTTFVVRFTPTSTGLKTAEISIANDDSDENPYNFTIQGTGAIALSGDYTIDPAGSGDRNFTTFASAVSALNIGISGAVTFNVAAGAVFTEDIPAITTTGTPINQVIFQKSGTGANPVIKPSGTTGISDFGLKLNYCDYYTFDGIDIQIATGSAVEYGIWLNGAATDGCLYNTFKNGAITLNKSNTNTRGIYLSSNATAATGANSYNKFYNNTITNTFIPVYASGASSSLDINNEFGGNSAATGNQISDFGGMATCYAIYLGNQNGVKAAYNNISSTGSSNTIRGIYVPTVTDASLYINHNTITIVSSATTSQISGIECAATGSGTVEISDNVFDISSATNTSGVIYGIYNSGAIANLNISNNRINQLKSTTAGTTSGNIYGIYSTSSVANLNINGNTITDLSRVSTGSSIISGIFCTGSVSNGNIFGNKVQNLNAPGASATVYGINIGSGTAIYLYNNLICDLKAASSTATAPISGINIAGGINVYGFYNSIYLNGTTAGAAISRALYASTGTTVDLRNNILINNIVPAASGKAVAYQRSSTTLSSYATTSNNNCYYAGTPSATNLIFYDGTNSDQTLDKFKERTGSRDNRSVTENVQFVNTTTAPYDLKIKTDIATQLNNSGAAVTAPIAVTADFDNNVRSSTAPDIGAYEFEGISVDLTPPSISYTLLSGSIPTATATVANVVISDLSSINGTAGKIPRFYFTKVATPVLTDWKYVEANESSSPFSFTVDYSLVDGIAAGDVIKYFVVAEDLAATPNVGANPTTGFAATSVDNITSAPATPNSYAILPAFSGVKSVGTGGDFASLSGANGLFAALNSGRVNGNITVNIISDIIEDGTVALNEWIEEPVGTNFSLTIQSVDDAVKVISGELIANKSLIKLNGADRVIIDGRAGQFLTIKNSNATAANAGAALELTNGSSNCKIVNVNLESNTTKSTLGTLLVNNTGANSNNLISKCRIANPAGAVHPNSAVYINGITNVNNTVSQCDIVNFSSYGIYLYAAGKTNIDSNRIFLDEASTSVALTAIRVDNGLESVISCNKIYNINGAATAAITGIYFYGASGLVLCDAVNNMIKLTPTTTGLVQGIDYNGYAGNNLNLYFNSVYIGGDMASGTNPSYAYLKRQSANIMNVKNNLFYNARTNSGTSTAKHFAVGFTTTPVATLAESNNLLYTVPAADPANTTLAIYGTAVKADLAAWQACTANLDIDSKNTAITFEPSINGDLKYTRHADNAAIYNTGVTISGITTDLYGTVRPQYSACDIGAFELENNSSLSDAALPKYNRLEQNYPNPFNPITTISFAIANECAVNLTVYNAKGETVKNLIAKSSVKAGLHSVNFDATGLNSGVYFYKLTTPENCLMKKMVLVK